MGAAVHLTHTLLLCQHFTEHSPRRVEANWGASLTWLPPCLWQGQSPTGLWLSSGLALESTHCPVARLRTCCTDNTNYHHCHHYSLSPCYNSTGSQGQSGQKAVSVNALLWFASLRLKTVVTPGQGLWLKQWQDANIGACLGVREIKNRQQNSLFRKRRLRKDF